MGAGMSLLGNAAGGVMGSLATGGLSTLGSIAGQGIAGLFGADKKAGSMKKWAAMVAVLCWSAFAGAVPQSIVVGIEQIDYYPHYDFSAGKRRGFFYDLMQLFGKTKGYQIRFEPLPVKRLYQEASSGIDLVYPDNPAWQKYLVAGYQKTFSEPVIYTLGSTIVLPKNQHIALEQFHSLAVIHGLLS